MSILNFILPIVVLTLTICFRLAIEFKLYRFSFIQFNLFFISKEDIMCMDDVSRKELSNVLTLHNIFVFLVTLIISALVTVLIHNTIMAVIVSEVLGGIAFAAIYARLAFWTGNFLHRVR